MAEYDISVESVELALLSDIGMPSAHLMKNAYLPDSRENPDEERNVPYSKPADALQDDGFDGPNARVYITKLSGRTPDETIEKILARLPGSKTNTGTHDFYTVVLCMSMRLGDPLTTRFINGTIDVALLRGVKILTYSPKDKGVVTGIIEQGGDVISIFPHLEFLASSAQGIKKQPEPPEKVFGIMVGPEEKITGTWRKKTGYSLDIPAGSLLEYQGMLKNDHEMFWEMYPPMPGQDIEITGKEMLVVFSLIVQAPKNFRPAITVHIEGRVKGNIWGVIPVKGSVMLP